MFKRVLRATRRRTLVLWLLVIVFVLPFILFFHVGVGGRPTRGPGGSAGELFGRAVPWEVFQQEYQLLRRNVALQFGEVPEILEPFLQEQTWNRLILREEARRRVKLNDEDVARHIQAEPAFQQDGRFVPELYYRLVKARGFTVKGYEELLRDELRITTLLDTVKAQVSLSEEEINAAYAKEYDQMVVRMILVEMWTLEDHARQGLSEAVLREYYAAHQDAVRLPAKRSLEYVGLSMQHARDAVTPITDEQLHAYYNDHAEEFKKEDGTPRPLEEVKEEIRQRVQDEQAQARLTQLVLDLEGDLARGLRFEELALTRGLAIRTVGPSERPAAGIPYGPTAPMLGAAFDAPLGQMTQVFDAPDGVFLLRAVKEIPSRVPAFEEVNVRVEQLVIQERAREAAGAKARQIHDELVALRANGLTVDEACLVLGVEPFQPAPFTSKGPVERLGSIPAVTQVLSTLKAGELSDVLEVPQGFVMAFVEDRLPYVAAQFASDKDTFTNSLRESKQAEHTATWFDTLRTQARLKSFLEETPLSP